MERHELQVGYTELGAIVDERHRLRIPPLTEEDLKGLDRADMEELPTGLVRRHRRLAGALEDYPVAKSGPFEHRYLVHGLLFPAPIDRRSSRPSLSTGMLFSFALFGRLFGPLSQERLVLGMTMPATGEAHWDVAVAFLREALGEHLNQREAADRIGKLIARNPGVGWGGWLSPPTEYLDTPDADAWW